MMLGEHGGTFWLAGAEDRAVPGRLILAIGSHPRLELDEPLTSPIREIVEGESADGRVIRKSLAVTEESHIVHGFVSGAVPPQRVTLVDTFTSDGNRGRQNLQARYALVGGHVADRGVRFTRLRLRLRHIDAWARLPGFELEDDRAQGGVTLTYRPADLPSVSLADGGQLTLDQDDVISMPTVVGGRLERAVWLRAFDLPPWTHGELDQNIVTPLANLLTLAVSSGCPPVEVEVATAPEQSWLSVHHAGLQAAADVLRSPYQMLLPRPDLDLEHIATWLGLVREFGPLPSAVADATGRHGGALQTQLLKLTTVAEGLHHGTSNRLRWMHKRMPGQTAKRVRRVAMDAVNGLGLDDDVRQAVTEALNRLEDLTYDSRLQQIAEYAEPAVPGVTGRTGEWKKHVKKARNRFAHQTDRGFLDQTTLDEYLAVLLSLRWLLTGLLLLQAGVSPDTIVGRIENHQQYQLFRRQVRHWLPGVYGPE